MAETERTFAELQALLADNDAKDISPRDLRDAVVSALGGYAAISVEGNATPQSIIATPAKADCFDTNGPYLGAAPDQSDDKITVGVAGVYLAVLTLDLTADTGAVLDAELYVADAASGLAARVAAGSDSAAASIAGLLSLSASEEVDVRLSCSPSAGVTVRNASLSIKRIG